MQSVVFVVEDQSFPVNASHIPKDSLLQELIDLTPTGEVIHITNCSIQEFQILYDYFREGKVPKVSEYYIFEYFKISPIDSYELATLHEDDLRANMYSGNEHYLYSHYALQVLDKKLWDSLAATCEIMPNMLFTEGLMTKASWFEFQTRLAKLQSFFHTQGVFIAGGALYCILFGLPISDIDVFIYGCDETQAEDRIYQLVQSLYEANLLDGVLNKNRDLEPSVSKY